MKKRRRGCPSSDSRKEEFENAVKSCMSRAAELMLRFLKYGAALERAITKAGYSEFRAPEVVAIMQYTAWISIG